MKCQHKIALLKYTTKNFWLLVIPLLRGLAAVGLDFYGFYNWLRGAYWDIMVIAVIIGLAYFRWKNIRYDIQENGIAVKSGMILKNEFLFPFSAVSCAAAKRSVWLRPFRAVTVSLDSDSHSASNKRGMADVELIIPMDDYKELFGKIPKASGDMKITYHASKGNLFLFSFVFSSTLSGVIFIGTLFIQGGRIVGSELEEMFFSAVSDVTQVVRTIIKGVTPFSVALTLVIAIGWGFSFVSNLLRHIDFRIKRNGENIFVENGFFTRRRYYINYSRINCADLRQNLLMKICKVMSVHAGCTGYGKEKNGIPVFVPITTRNRVMDSMRLILPRFTISNISIKTKKSYIIAFVWLPVLLAAAFPAAAWFIKNAFPNWSSVVNFLLIMAEIPTIYLLIVKIFAKFTTGIGMSDEMVTLKYCSMYQFHTIIVPKNKIAYVRLSQTLFQRGTHVCDVIVYTRGEHASRHRLRGIPVLEAEDFAHSCNV